MKEDTTVHTNLIRVGIIGDYDKNRLSHKATNEALQHSAAALSMELTIEWLPTIELENNLENHLSGFDAFWCAPGSPYRSFHGAIAAIRFARERNTPFIGTCGGFQHAVMEYAQNVLAMEEVNHEEYDKGASTFFITALSCSLIGETGKIYLKTNSMIQNIYGQSEIEERYNCSFGLNPSFQDAFEHSGFHAAGIDANGEVRIFELPQNRYYVATLFQPQLSSTPENPHKLINEYLLAAQEFQNKKQRA